MTFAQYFKISSYCFIASGFVAIAATGGIDIPSIVLFSCVLVASWFVDTVKLRQKVPRLVLNWFALVYFPFFALDYGLLSRSLTATAFHLMLFTAAFKLLTLSRNRDYFHLYLISLAELLAAATLTVNINFFVCFFVFLLSGISTSVLFEMHRSNAAAHDKAGAQTLLVSKEVCGIGSELLSPFPARVVSAMVLGITLLTLTIAVPLFFLLPRITMGYHNRPSGPTRFLSGFSERVELGQIGRIKLSDALVMRVKLSEPVSGPASTLKWRGVALDYYDGRSWTRSSMRRRAITAQGGYYKLEEFSQGADLLVQTFFVEALSTNVVFAAHKALAISTDVGFLQRDSKDNLYTAQHPFRKVRYTAVSDAIRPDPDHISDLLPVPAEIASVYLQVSTKDPRIAQLAADVTRTAVGKYAKARLLERYLQTHYGYSLELSGSPHSTDPLAFFLFEVRRGHCEYFGSAMAIMLRHLGIPSRLVNGFRAGEYNSIGRDWIVRQYDAHSWVEAYFPPYGWIEFDPTPLDPRRARPAFSRIVSNFADALDLWWWEEVVSYNSAKQYRLVSGLRSKIADLGDGMKRLLDFVYTTGRRGSTLIDLTDSKNLMLWFARRWIYWIPLLLLVLLSSYKTRRKLILRRFRRALFPHNQALAIRSFYEEALELLAIQGMKRKYGQTFLEFAHELGERPAALPFADLTRMYNRIRFGPPGSTTDLSRAEALLQLVRKSLRHRPGEPC